ADGIALRGAEVRLYLRPAAAEFCGSVWAVRHFGQPDVLGVSVGDAAADGGASFGAKDNAEFVIGNLKFVIGFSFSELKITNYKFYNFHLVADLGKLFSTNPNTVFGRTTNIGSFMLRGSILYFFL